MPALSEDRIAELLVPFMNGAPMQAALCAQLGVYLDLLLKWNERTNLTAIRDPEEIVTRHFGESLFLGGHLPPPKTLLDYGSGAGFPGLPIQMLLPQLKVTLAESQGKKASFLREAVRVLGLDTEVWPHRAETMNLDRRFDVVAMRAVDNMERAIEAAHLRVAEGGTLALLVTSAEKGIAVPGARNRLIRLIHQTSVFHVEH